MTDFIELIFYFNQYYINLKKLSFVVYGHFKTNLQIYGNRRKTVTGMAAYDYDLRPDRSISKAGPASKPQTHQSSSISRSYP